MSSIIEELKKIRRSVDDIAQGGGGGGGLPPVTSEDNGDVLTVVEGVWDKAAPSGSGLPQVTSDDNGDVLTVVEGAWEKAAPSGGVETFAVTLTENEDDLSGATFISDKTCEEVLAAVKANKSLVIDLGYGSILHAGNVYYSEPDDPAAYNNVNVMYMVWGTLAELVFGGDSSDRYLVEYTEYDLTTLPQGE